MFVPHSLTAPTHQETNESNISFKHKLNLYLHESRTLSQPVKTDGQQYERTLRNSGQANSIKRGKLTQKEKKDIVLMWHEPAIYCY